MSLDFFSTLARAERHHVFPINFLRQLQVQSSKVHLLPNFVFIPGDLNREISDKAPAEYMAQYREENPNFQADIKTHLVPIGSDSAIWANDYDSFLEQRAALMAERLNQLLEAGPIAVEPEEPIIPDDAHQVIEAVELQLRDLIDDRLSAVAGSMYWDKTVPEKTQNKVNAKIGQHVSSHPYLNPAVYAVGRKKLDFCDIGDYVTIIKANWSQFAQPFGNQDNALRHLDDFRKLRNIVAHNNNDQLTEVVRKNAEAAIVWLQGVFDANLNGEDADSE